MDYKRILNIAMLISTLFFVVGIVLSFPEKIRFCLQDLGCIGDLSLSYGEPFVLSSFFLGFIFLILRFLPKKVFTAWLFFGVWYIPIALFLIAMWPVDGELLFGGRTWMVMNLGGIYMSVSILIIVIRLLFLKFRRK